MSEYIVERENVYPYGSQREEIVRCRDCRHWKTWDLSSMFGNHEHDKHACFRFVDGWLMEAPTDGYCWRGERK